MAKIVISSDWQLTADNLHIFKQIVDQLFTYCDKHKCKTIVHVGDSKHHYNPLDIRVLNFKIGVIKEAIRREIQWIQIRGNHDRISMSDDGGSWLPALRAAGALTITRPKTVLAASTRLFCVPYYSDTPTLVDAFKRAAQEASSKDSLLFFHNSILGCKANVISSLKEGVGLQDLFYKKYIYCVGGHIHLPQQLGSTNVYYVGSAVSQDWGEANQYKRFLVYDSDERKLHSEGFKVPGMYDTSWPGFKEQKSWSGAQIRIHVPCDASIADVNKVLLKATTTAEHQYPGAKIHAVPEFIDKATAQISKLAITDDEVALKDYIESTCPPYLSNYKNELISFLKFKLAEKGFIRRSSQAVKFLWAEGKNYLGFKRVKIDFRHKGITVVTGKNLDWPKRNNGSGKTSLLSLPLVALHGKTLKGQANDKWVRRDSKGIAWVKLKLRLQDDRKSLVSRTRRPGKLNLFINGRDESTGIGKRGTQQAIENITGLTWEALRNAIYIDQAEINEILKSSSERKSVFTKLLNLERFEVAKEILKKELKKVLELKDIADSDILTAREKVRDYTAIIDDYDTADSLDVLKVRLSKISRLYTIARKRIIRLEKLKRRAIRKYDALKEKYNAEDGSNKQRLYIELRGAYKKDLTQFSEVKDKCPSCKQAVSQEWRKQRIRILEKGMALVNKKIEEQDKIEAQIEKILDKAKRKIEFISNKLVQKNADVITYSSKKEALAERFEKAKKLATIKKKYSLKLDRYKNRYKRLKQYAAALDHDIAFLQYGIKVFSKDGLPSYLIQTMVPQLNFAAEKYSRLISENEIKVKFITDEEGSIDVQIDNAHGGEELDDQSQGETRIASIITSFSMREVINPANLLILDEPGEGLDSHNAALFARVLKEIANKFGTVLITSHNSIILAELANERTICIVKQNKIARIVN